jgi:hypothetical protein
MSPDTLEPLDPELDALLEAERQRVAPGEALGRIASRLAVAPVAATGGAAKAGWLASHAGKVALVAFVAGGAAGATAQAVATKPPEPRIVYIEKAAPPSAAAPAPPVPSAVVLPPPPVVAPPLPPRVAPSTSASSLSAERALLDRARSELASGNAARAVVLLDEHAHRFQKPQLAEEREALAIQSLVALGRYDEARAEAARFRAMNPGSLFLPAIEASVGSIP